MGEILTFSDMGKGDGVLTNGAIINHVDKAEGRGFAKCILY